MRFPSQKEIAGIKARGFDRTVIEAAELQSKRGVEAQAICEKIQSAFAGVQLGGGVGLQQAQGLDDYEDDETCAAWRADDEKEDWSRITSHRLNCCNSSLSFLDAEGMRFHLPAFLIADIKGEYGFGTDFTLTDLSEHRLKQFNLLSAEQRDAVRGYLEFIRDDPDYQFGRSEIDRALAGYWSA